MTVGPTGLLLLGRHIGTNYLHITLSMILFLWYLSIATTLTPSPPSISILIIIPRYMNNFRHHPIPIASIHHSQHLLFSSSTFIPHPHNLFHLIRSTHPIRSIPLQPNEAGHKQATSSVHIPSLDSIPRGLPHMCSRIGEGRSSPTPP